MTNFNPTIAKASLRTTAKWTLKRLPYIFLLLLVCCTGFEIWRQSEIDNARQELNVTRATIKQSLKTTATYDEYRAGLENGRDGSGEFRRYLQLTREFEINIGSDPEFDLVHKYVIPDLDFPIGKDHLHYSNIHRWLNYASPMLKQFTKCSEFDFFALDSREQGFSNPDGPKETAWNAGLPDVIFPLRCCFTYSALGQQNKSLQILDAIERATLALRSSTSIDQLLLHFEFDDNYRWASMELAAQGLLDEPRLLRAIDYEPTRKTTLLNTMTGTMLALSETTQEEPLSILDHTVENKYPTAWFSWIRFSSLESEGFRNDSTSGRAEYYLDASSWIDETCKLLPKISAGDHVKSKYYLSHHWNDALRTGDRSLNLLNLRTNHL